MRKARSCVACGAITTQVLLNDEMLGIAICSKECETRYLNSLTLSVRDRLNTLRELDGKIKGAKQHEKMSWMIAGLGLLMIAVGYLSQEVIVFLLGIFPLTFGALLTGHFEGKRNRLVKLRKQVAT